MSMAWGMPVVVRLRVVAPSGSLAMVEVTQLVDGEHALQFVLAVDVGTTFVAGSNAEHIVGVDA